MPMPLHRKGEQMSTHALIGKRVGSGFKARFVHFDGYPSAMMPALQRVMRDENPIAYALGNHWRSFNPHSQEPAESFSHDVIWYDHNSNIDHSYLYLLDEETKKIECFINLDSKWVEINPTNEIKRERE